MSYSQIIIVALYWVTISCTFPISPNNSISQGTKFELLSGSTTRGLSNDVPLRILSLGASIVYGYNSPDGNGFRLGVRTQLVQGGTPVDMIGSVKAGTMIDNDVEGWGGFRINEVPQKAELDIPAKLNLVLLHVSTNDMLQNFDVVNAPARLATLIDHLFDSIPGVTVICSSLLPNGNSDAEARTKAFNSKIPGLVADRQKNGKKILQADFHSSNFSVADLGSDGIHPTGDGYTKMAAVWYQTIKVAANLNWITAPASTTGFS